MLAGARIVLGVTGGIAAYKAVEVCRRLVDAGAHVVPGDDRGCRALHRPHDAVGAGQRAGADRACGTRPTPIPHTRLGQTRRPRARRPGHGPRCSAPTPPGLSDRPADERPARDAGAGDRRPGDAHRDVGAPGGARQHRDVAPPRRARRRARRRPPRRRRHRAGPPRRPGRHRRRGRARARPRQRPRRDCGRRHRRRHPRADRRRAGHRQPQQRQAGLRDRRRGGGPRAPTSRSSPRSTCPRPHGVAVVDRSRPPPRCRPRRGRARPTPTSSSWPPPSPTSGPRRPPPARSRRTTACPRSSSSRRPTSSPASARRSAPARRSSGSPPRPTTSSPTPRPSCARKRLDLIVANDVGAPGVGFQHDTNAVTLLRPDAAAGHRSTLADKRAIARPSSTASSRSAPASSPIPPDTAYHDQETHRVSTFDLHIRERHRGPSRQDGRPGQRRRARRHPHRGPRTGASPARRC